MEEITGWITELFLALVSVEEEKRGSVKGGKVLSPSVRGVLGATWGRKRIERRKDAV